VAENASYYVFTHAPDGAIEAFPLQEWYNFQPIQRYKSLTAEEAEEQFGRLVLLKLLLTSQPFCFSINVIFSVVVHVGSIVTFDQISG
jgi:hypothetical protein